MTIVFGVLVALQFDAWRERRSDNVRERQQLLALSADFESIAVRIGETLVAQRKARDAAWQLLPIFQAGTTSLSPDSIARAYVFALSWYEMEPVTGAYDALIASGDIGLLRNVELRRRLAEFYGELAAGFEDHQNEMDVLALMLDKSNDALLGLTPIGIGFNYGEAHPNATLQLVANRSVGGLLTWKALIANNRLVRLERLAANADSIGALISRDARAH